MTFELYTDAALLHDLPEYRLRRGDLVRLVEHHIAPGGEEGYSAEVMGVKDRTRAVIAVAAKSLRMLHDDEILTVRTLRD